MAEMSSQTMQTDETRSSRNVRRPEALRNPSAGGDTNELGRRTLDNAEKLLEYAVKAGIDAEPDVIRKDHGS